MIFKTNLIPLKMQHGVSDSQSSLAYGILLLNIFLGFSLFLPYLLFVQMVVWFIIQSVDPPRNIPWADSYFSYSIFFDSIGNNYMLCSFIMYWHYSISWTKSWFYLYIQFFSLGKVQWHWISPPPPYQANYYFKLSLERAKTKKFVSNKEQKHIYIWLIWWLIWPKWMCFNEFSVSGNLILIEETKMYV